MNIIEILERPSPAYYTVEEISFAIEEYIFQKKGQRIKVNIFKDLNMSNLNQKDIIKLDIQYTNLMMAFNTVQLKYNKNNDYKN